MALSNEMKLAKLIEKLNKLKEQKKRVDSNIKYTEEKINVLKNIEQNKIMNKLMGNPDTLKTLVDKNLITKEEMNLLINEKESKTETKSEKSTPNAEKVNNEK